MKLTHPLQIASIAALSLTALLAPLTPAHAVGNSDGAYPASGLTLGADGNLYGVTSEGGTYDHGVLLRFTPGGDGHPDVLYNFGQNLALGESPSTPLVEDEFGNFYGTTHTGGKFSSGVVYSFSADGVYQVLFNLGGSSNPSGTPGVYPDGALLEYAPGKFVGTTSAGSYGNNGTVYTFSVTGAATFTPTLSGNVVYHDFRPTNGAGSKGANPITGLVFGPGGLLYGTASQGGDHGSGTIYSFNPSPGAGPYIRMIHSFKDTVDDGAVPYAPLTFVPAGPSGTLYGTTPEGGKNGYGTIFAYGPGDEHTILNLIPRHGAAPTTGLALDTGTGALFADPGNYGDGGGTVFQIANPSFSGDNLMAGPYFYFNFDHQADGYIPVGSLVYDPNDGLLYGMTLYGGHNNEGAIYSIEPPSLENGGQLVRTILHSFGD